MTRLRNLAAVVGGLAVVLAASALQPAEAAPARAIGPALAAAPHPTPDGIPAGDPTYELVNYHSHECAHILNASTGIAALDQQPCSNGGVDHAQVWATDTTTADGIGYLIINYHSGLCVEPQSASTTAGVALLQTGCDYAGTNHGQDWSPFSADDGSGTLWVNYHSHLCMHVANNSVSTGARLDQQPCDYAGGNHAMVWNSIRVNIP